MTTPQTKLVGPFTRHGLLTILYATLFLFSLWLSYQLRFDFEVPPFYASQFLVSCVWILPLTLVCLYSFGQFNDLLSYFSIPDLKRIVYAMGSASLAVFAVRALELGSLGPPRGVILSNFMISIAELCTMRLVFRTVRERYLAPQTRPRRRSRRVAIVGAGDVGAKLAREFLSKPWQGIHPVCFLDDLKRPRSTVHGLTVAGPPELLLDQTLDLKGKLRIEEVVIAMPSASPKRIGELVSIFRTVDVKMRIVPSLAQLASGQAKVTALRNVEIQDLLGRATVEIDSGNVAQILEQRVVMVTGAGGSIGSELCRQAAMFEPEKLILVERSEPQLFAIEQELLESNPTLTIVPLVADILDISRMDQLLREFTPDIIFHAAAHKHVPMMEHQPMEAVKNNSIGTAHLATLVAHHKVDRFVLVSTDKAINPTSVMGASKRLAEMFLQGLHADDSHQTKFMAVRFGNVLGSSGSVVPIFSRQIAAGGPVTVTHPEVRRYFMTIPEATRLVLQSAAQGEGGEIFVLDMGDPIKIIDLARQMIELSGLVAEKDIEIEITGLRPGEKLFEELSHHAENLRPTNHPKVMRFVADPLPLKFVRTAIEEFVQCVSTAEPEQIKAMLKSLIPEYQPFALPPENARSERAGSVRPNSLTNGARDMQDPAMFAAVNESKVELAPFARSGTASPNGHASSG